MIYAADRLVRDTRLLSFFTRRVIDKQWRVRLQIGKQISRFARVCSKHFTCADFISKMDHFVYSKVLLLLDEFVYCIITDLQTPIQH